MNDEKSKVEVVEAVFEGIGEVVSGVFAMIIFVAICGAIFLWGYGDGLNSGEREGMVTYDDCREKIPMTENAASFRRIYQAFTCEYEKTGRGRILGGTCVHIEYDKNQGCKVAYTYKRRQDEVCKDPKFPVLGTDDSCHPASSGNAADMDEIRAYIAAHKQ